VQVVGVNYTRSWQNIKKAPTKIRSRGDPSSAGSVPLLPEFLAKRHLVMS
jgi:hypothetical protein